MKGASMHRSLSSSGSIVSTELTAHLGLKRDGSLKYQPAAITAVKHRLEQGGNPLNFPDFFNKLIKINLKVKDNLNDIRQLVILAENDHKDHPRDGNGKKFPSKDTSKGGGKSDFRSGQKGEKPTPEKSECYMCGWTHVMNKCPYANALHRNRENVPFKESRVGNELLERYAQTKDHCYITY
jgi:hypothetical protein